MPALALSDHGNLFARSSFTRSAGRRASSRSSAARSISRRATRPARGSSARPTARRKPRPTSSCSRRTRPAIKTWSSSSPPRTSTACTTSRGSTRTSWRNCRRASSARARASRRSRARHHGRPHQGRGEVDRRLQEHLRPGRFLPRDRRPRHSAGALGRGGNPEVRQGVRPEDRRHERRPLRAEGPRLRARRAALHPDRREDQ